MIDALTSNEVYNEFVIFETGQHGLALADETAIKDGDTSYINKEVSIDSPVKMNNDSGNTHTYEEILPDTRFMIDDSADELLYLADQSGIKGLREMLEYDALGYRPSEVASMKGEKEKTLEELGQVYGVTRERIRQIESKTLRRLKHATVKDRLRDYYENQ